MLSFVLAGCRHFVYLFSAKMGFFLFLDFITSKKFDLLLSSQALESFTDVTIDERTESKATKSKKIKTEVEENYPLTNCHLYSHVSYCLQFIQKFLCLYFLEYLSVSPWKFHHHL